MNIFREVFDPRTWDREDKKLFIQVSFLVGILFGIAIWLGFQK